MTYLAEKTRLALAVGALWLISAAPARADLRIESTVTVTGGRGERIPAGERKVVTYYRGTRVRQEWSTGMVILYQRETDRIYTLDTRTRTYSWRSYRETMQASIGADRAKRKDVRISVGASLKPLKSSATAARLISDREASPFALELQAKARPSGMGALLGSRTFTPGRGTVWAVGARGGADPLALPGSKREDWLPLAQLVMPPGTPGLEPLTEALAKQKLIPLASYLTLQRPNQKPSSPVTIAMEVTSVQEGITLEESLFQLPGDYQPVSAEGTL